MLEFGLWGRKIYFLELNWINLPLVSLFRLVGIHVFFLTTTKFWQKEARLKKLNSLGVTWINCHEININNGSSFLVKANELRECVRLRISQKIIFQDLKKHIKLKDCEEKSLSAVLVKSLDSKIVLLAQLLVCAEFIEGENTKNYRLWIANDFLTKSILEKEERWKNICPGWVSFLKFSISLVFIIAGKSLKRFIKIYQSILHNSPFFKSNNRITSGIKVESNWSKYEIIYFPHVGIFYEKHYMKDQFYSSKKDNPFYPTKILHLETLNLSLPEDLNNFGRSQQHYLENNIPHAEWRAITGISNKDILLMSFYFFNKNLISLWIEFDLHLFVVILYNYILIMNNIKRLEKITKLRIVLVGYDILFPPQLALACKMKKISTVAVQERMISAWWASPFLMEHYFVYGGETSRALEKRCKDLIINKYESGPIRLSNHYDAAKKTQYLNSSLPLYKWRVLVLDNPSEADFYKDGRRMAHNWSNILRFYQDILRLCTVFPQAHFMIKGKNFDFINIPYFSDVVSKLNKTTNCMIVKDFVKWTPFTSVSVSDIAIAMHTSLGDEMLALGKPVIFYNLFAFPSQIFDYGPEVLAYTFKDLKLKLDSFFENPDKYNQRLDSIRKKCFSVSNVSPKRFLNNKLTQIYQESFV